MKRKTIIAFLAAVMMFSVYGCGNETENTGDSSAAEKNDTTPSVTIALPETAVTTAEVTAVTTSETVTQAVTAQTSAPETEKPETAEGYSSYDDILREMYHFVSDPNGMNGSLPGISGVSDALAEISDDQRTEVIGYGYTDLNGDDIRELVIGNTENTDVLAAYTISEGKVVCYVTSGASEKYNIIEYGGVVGITEEDGTVTSFGQYFLPEYSTELKCLDIYFTADDKYYHNGRGLKDKDDTYSESVSKEFYMSELSDIQAEAIVLNLKPFSSLKDIDRAVRADIPNYSSEEDIDLSNGSSSPGTPVQFMASEDIKNFRIVSVSLALAEDDGVYCTENEVLYTKDELLKGGTVTANVVFHGDLPEYGIVYEDSEGNTVRNTLQLSGRDGSASLSDYYLYR